VKDQISGNTGHLQNWQLLLYGSVQPTHGCEADPLEEIPDLVQDTTCVSASSIRAANRISNSVRVQYSAPIVQLVSEFAVESGSEFLIIN
jgi:subtilisin-like proprotein convertase family protein